MVFAGLLCLCFMLCGCTRREQLVLEGASAGKMERTAEMSVNQQEDEAGQGTDGEDRFGQTQARDESEPAGLQSGQAQQTAGEQPGQIQNGIQSTDTNQSDGAQSICVHVCGAVKKPGVYALPADSRVYEAVEKAGGFSENADPDYVNQAQQLADGWKLVIPTMKETEALAAQEDSVLRIGMVGPEGEQQTASGQQVSAGAGSRQEDSGAGSPGNSSDGRININTASLEELCAIPGIGSTRAAAIIAYRQETGGFTSVEDIMNVSGIKEGTYAKIKNSIKVK